MIDIHSMLKGTKAGELIILAARSTGKSNFYYCFDQMSFPITDIILDDTQAFNGVTYYGVTVHGGNKKEILAWAELAYGPPADTVYQLDQFAWPDGARWANRTSDYWFRKESDRTMFLMRWNIGQ